MSAWLPASILAEKMWHLDAGFRSLQSTTIDTAKFFDSSAFAYAAEALQSTRVELDCIATKCIRR